MVKRCANGHYFDGDKFSNCPYCNAEDVNERNNVTVAMGGVGKMFSDARSDDDDNKTISLDQTNDYQPSPNYMDDDDATIPIMPQGAVQKAVKSEEPVPVPPAPSFDEAPSVTANIPSEESKNFSVPNEGTLPMNQPAQVQFTTPVVPPAPTVPSAPAAPEPSFYAPPAPAVQGGYSDLINNARRNPVQTDDNPTVSIYGSKMKSEPTVGWLIGLSGPYTGECFELRAGKNFIGRGQDMDIVLAADNTVSRYRHAVVLYEPKARMFLAQPGESRELFYINDKVVLNNQPIEAYDKLTLGDTKLMFFPLCSKDFSWDDVQEDK